MVDYTEFCKAKRPEGLGRNPEEIDALLREGGRRTAREMVAEEPPLNSNGGDRKTEEGGSANGRRKSRSAGTRNPDEAERRRADLEALLNLQGVDLPFGRNSSRNNRPAPAAGAQEPSPQVQEGSDL